MEEKIAKLIDARKHWTSEEKILIGMFVAGTTSRAKLPDKVLSLLIDADWQEIIDITIKDLEERGIL